MHRHRLQGTTHLGYLERIDNYRGRPCDRDRPPRSANSKETMNPIPYTKNKEYNPKCQHTEFVDSIAKTITELGLIVHTQHTLLTSMEMCCGETPYSTLTVGTRRFKPWGVVIYHHDRPVYCIDYYETEDRFEEVGRTTDVNLMLAVVCGGVRFKL